MNTYETINDVLVHLFNEIWELEEKAIITEEYKDITNNDMHIIEAIGMNRKRRTGISSSCGFSYPDDRCGDTESGER